MIFQTPAALAIALFFVCSQLLADFCPICCPAKISLREYCEGSDFVVLGELIKIVPANKGQDFPGTAAVKITIILNDKSNKFEVGEILTLQRDFKISEGNQLLLVGDIKSQNIHWKIVEKSSSAVQDYILNSPKIDASPKEQLIFFLNFLEHQDPLIAKDAFEEVNTSDRKLMVNGEISKFLKRTEIRSWISQARLNEPDRVSLYAILLGVCGDDSDIIFLKEMIKAKRDDYKIGLDGAMTGLILLSGEQGLSFLEQEIHKESGSSVPVQFSVIQAVRFMQWYAEGRIANDRLCQTMRILLKNPTLADLVILDLARWEDWGVRDRLMKMYSNEKYNAPSIKRAIVRYFLIAAKSWDETSDEETPAYVIQAKQNLKTLEEEDPETMRKAKRYLFN